MRLVVTVHTVRRAPEDLACDAMQTLLTTDAYKAVDVNVGDVICIVNDSVLDDCITN